MTTRAYTGSSRKRLWHGFSVLALLVLSVVLATPACDAHELSSSAAGYSQESGLCCALHEPGLVAGPYAVQASVKAGIALAPPALVAAPPWSVMTEYRAALPPPQAPPRSLPPYHARSARILA